MTFRSAMRDICRHATTIGGACTGAPKRLVKSHIEVKRDERQAAATAELQSVLGGCITPPNLTLPTRKRKKD